MRQKYVPSWLQLEVPSSDDITPSLCAHLFSPSPLDKLLQKSFVVRNSVLILRQIKKANHITRNSIYAPMCQNPLFKPGQLHGAFVTWKKKGIVTFADLFIDGQFASFTQLCSKFKLPNSNFFRYLQIRHFVMQTFRQIESIPKSHPFHDTLRLTPDSPHLITKFVNCFTIVVSSDHLGNGFVLRSARRSLGNGPQPNPFLLHKHPSQTHSVQSSPQVTLFKNQT